MSSGSNILKYYLSVIIVNFYKSSYINKKIWLVEAYNWELHVWKKYYIKFIKYHLAFL